MSHFNTQLHLYTSAYLPVLGGGGGGGDLSTARCCLHGNAAFCILMATQGHPASVAGSWYLPKCLGEHFFCVFFFIFYFFTSSLLLSPLRPQELFSWKTWQWGGSITRRSQDTSEASNVEWFFFFIRLRANEREVVEKKKKKKEANLSKRCCFFVYWLNYIYIKIWVLEWKVFRAFKVWAGGWNNDNRKKKKKKIDFSNWEILSTVWDGLSIISDAALSEG